jgi:hypothetical protein
VRTIISSIVAISIISSITPSFSPLYYNDSRVRIIAACFCSSSNLVISSLFITIRGFSRGLTSSTRVPAIAGDFLRYFLFV